MNFDPFTLNRSSLLVWSAMFVKIYEIIFRSRYMTYALVLQSTAFTINIGLREISEFWLALLNSYQVLTHQRAIFWKNQKYLKRKTTSFGSSSFSLAIYQWNGMAELLEEFDQPSPLPVSFCQQIPSEEFDKRSAQNTRDALHDLINHFEAKPEEFYKIVRRKKADNLKLFQYLKVKVLNKLQDDYLEKYFPENQCREELENLMHDMESAFNYAQGLSTFCKTDDPYLT